MLILRTGLPGSGKTLNTIREIEREHAPNKKTPNIVPRTIYYYGIPDLDTSKLQCNWVEFDTPEEWYNLPDGSVIVIDEAQRVFGAQDGRKARPEKVARFETHRHQGFDIHLITQHPSLLISHVRKLVGKHINMYRPYGGATLRRHEYEYCVDHPDKRSNFKLSQETKVKLDSKYYGTYRSATVHTHKFKLPVYVWYIAPLALFIVGCMGYVWWTYTPAASAEAVAASSPGRTLSPAKSAPEEAGYNPLKSAQGALSGEKPPLTADEYAASLKPRIEGIPGSAPRYDQLTQPKSFPRLTCASSTDPNMVFKARERGQPVGRIGNQEYMCQCYTQQSTKANTTAELCLSIVQNGFFDDTIPDRQQLIGSSTFGHGGSQSAATGRGPAAQLPQSGVSANSGGVTVIGIPDNSRTPRTLL